MPQATAFEQALGALAPSVIEETIRVTEIPAPTFREGTRAEYARASGQSDPGGIEARGRTRGLIDASHWAIQRVLPLSDIRWVEAGSHAERFMSALRREPGLSNRDLAERLAVDETQISRSGRKLRLHGLVVSRLVGRRNHWELTPKGMRGLELLTGIHSADHGVAAQSDEGGGDAACITALLRSYCFSSASANAHSRSGLACGICRRVCSASGINGLGRGGAGQFAPCTPTSQS